MEYRVISDLGRFGATGLIEIPPAELAVDQRPAGDGARITVDLSGMTAVVPAGANGQVVVKDNFLNARSVFPLPAGDAARHAIDLERPLHPSRTEIEVVFTEPGDSRIVAVCRGLRLRDDKLDWSGGVSFFRTRRDPSARRPVTLVMEVEGPLFVLGELGPASAKQAGEDFHFLAGHVIAAIEKCATHLLLDEDNYYSGEDWDHLRQRIAEARGFASWREVREDYLRSEDLEAAARECADVMFTNRKFYNDIKLMHEAQVRRADAQEESE